MGFLMPSCFTPSPRSTTPLLGVVRVIGHSKADENLSHLDSIVAAALAAGAVGYSPPAEAEGDSDEDEVSQGGGVGSSLNLTPYARPSQVKWPTVRRDGEGREFGHSRTSPEVDG